MLSIDTSLAGATKLSELGYCFYCQRNVYGERDYNLAILVILLIFFFIIGIIYYFTRDYKCPIHSTPLGPPAMSYGYPPMYAAPAAPYYAAPPQQAAYPPQYPRY